MPQTLTVATWNINSVRLRIELVRDFLERHRPDVLCLQETKCQDASFPAEAFVAAGYPHLAVHGQKTWHGVAIASRLPLVETERRSFWGIDEARHVSVELDASNGPIRLHNFYVPAGGDLPDAQANPKFAHKLGFIDEMAEWGRFERGAPAIMVGDLNIAPLETDVWSHKQLLDVVSHTPVEVEGMERMRAAGEWRDVVRAMIHPREKLFSWWSYRAKDWNASDRGRRLDHVWARGPIAERVRAAHVLREARGWERPSDHVPVLATFEIG